MKPPSFLIPFILPILAKAQTTWTLRSVSAPEGLFKPAGKAGVYLIPTGKFTPTNPADQYYLRSVDGVTWTPVQMPPSFGNFGSPGMVCKNDRFLMIGEGRVFTSDNGIDAANFYSIDPAWSAPYSVAYGNGRWVVTEGNGHVLVSTNNAVSWTPYTTPSDDIYSVTFGGGKFIALAADGSSLASVDGITWEVGPSIPGDGICFDANQWATTTHVSANGRDWNERTNPQILPGSSLRSGNGGFVSWDDKSQPQFFTSDGQTWSGAIPSGVLSGIEDVCYCGNLWIAVTISGKVLTSPIPATPPPVAPVLNVAPALRLSWQSAAGRSYRIQRSIDQTLWTDHSGLMSGSGATMEWLAPASAAREFFRVQVR